MSEPDFYSKDKKEYYKRKSGGSNRKKEYSKLIRVNSMQFFNKTLCCRFKVNKDWLSGIDSLLFLYTLSILIFYHRYSYFFAFMPFLSPFYQLTCSPNQRKYYICIYY